MKTTTPIKNAPAYAENYPYIVAQEIRHRWQFVGAYDCEALALKAAVKIGGLVFYNKK